MLIKCLVGKYSTISFVEARIHQGRTNRLSRSRSCIRSGGDSNIVKHKIGRSFPIIFERLKDNKIEKHKIVTKFTRSYYNNTIFL